MASLITPQFEQYIAQQTINKGTVVFDEFIFANIPGLTAENLKNHLTMPQAEHIVHRQTVSQSGVVNENAVVYSVTIGTEIGDFDFNFIGLVNKSKNMLAVAIQTTPVKKVRNKNAVQGNSITRNVLLEFRGAKALTNINVTAQTWQIDFTVRLHGIDEKIRLTNRDLYGRAVFFDDSFLVKRKSGNDYTIEPGVAYVEGVRANMTALENINAANLPCSIYLDVVHHCTVTGAYETEIKFLKANKADYTDTTNRPHYVQILADIDRNGVVTDRRLLSPFLGINPLDLDDTTSNKADKNGHTHRLPLASLIKRGIVKLYSGYDSDAEDLAATPKAIKTLKAFIDALTRNLGNYIPNSKKSSRVDSNSADDVATSAAVKTANDNANTRVAKSGDTMTGNLTVPNLIVNDPTNNNNSVQIGDDTKLIDVDISHTVGLQTTDNANDAYIAYGETKKRFGFDGNMFFADSALATNYIGHGSYAQQYNVAAPFYVHQTLSVARDTYHPFIKGRVRSAGQYGAAFSFGYTTNQNRGSDGYGTGVIHLISDAGAERLWRFGHNGEFASAGDVITSAGRSLNSAIYREGNPHDIALSWLRDGLKVRVDATDLGRVAFQHDIHTALRGAVCAFAMGHPPAGWLKCNGAAVSRTAYADLFSIIGTHYGAGDGHSTFNLPDLRGEFIRGIDEGRGADPNRAFGSWQSDEIRSHNHFIQFDGVAAGRRGAAEGAIHSGSGKPYYTDHTGGNETRPRNVALLYCIKY